MSARLPGFVPSVSVENGRIVKIDGGHQNQSTRGYICGKVRRFAERVYGEDRVLYPAVRKGTKGDGVFSRVSWQEALDFIAERMAQIRDREGGGGDPAVLLRRIERAADAGHERRAALWRRLGTSRLARTVCAAPTGAANMGLPARCPASPTKTTRTPG